MDVSNATAQSAGYKVIFGSKGIPTVGTPEAELSEARASADFQEGRYETFRNAEDLIRALRERSSVQAVTGWLAPFSSRTLARSGTGEEMRVDFFVGGELVASQTLSREPAQLTLREAGGKFRIDVKTGEPASLRVGHAS